MGVVSGTHNNLNILVSKRIENVKLCLYLHAFKTCLEFECLTWDV